MNNYKLLPALMALLETRNLTDAARRLNVTQPAMSKALRLIRDEFQDPILIRDG
ncbi:LysR family transcriptional regulator, partial [Vibrio furnissii]